MIESFRDCVRRSVADDDHLAHHLESVVLYGSAVRGDFDPGLSDVDVFAVLEEGAVDEEAVVDGLETVLEECAADLDVREVDLAWEFAGNLSDPLREGVPFKFLTIYQADFRRHHAVIHGDDPVEKLPEYDFDELLDHRIDRLRRLVDEADGRDHLEFVAGETARLLAVVSGADSLRKDDVLDTLREGDHEQATRVYEAYLGRREPLPSSTLREFVRAGTDRIVDVHSSGTDGA